jgi:hypothetical protein
VALLALAAAARKPGIMKNRQRQHGSLATRAASAGAHSSALALAPRAALSAA